jgi:flagellar biogenesis protein FliO
MDLLQPLAAVGFVLALLGVTLMLLKKRGAASFRLPRLSGGGPRRLESLERLSLGPQHALHLIQIDGRTILVATAPTSFQIVCEAETK